MEEPIIKESGIEDDERMYDRRDSTDVNLDNSTSILFSNVELNDSIHNSKVSLFTRLTSDKAVLKAVHLAVGFCLLFIGFNACQPLVTTFHDKDGSVGLALLYIVYGLASFVSPIVVDKVGTRVSLFVSSLGYVLFIIGVEPYLDSVFYVISIIEGFAAAVLWTSQSVYLNNCAPDASVLGKFSGIFFSIYLTSGVLGNLFSGMLFSLNVGDKSALYAFAAFSFCGSLTLLMLRPPRTKEKVDIEIKMFSEKSHMSPPTSPVMETPMLGIEKEANNEKVKKPAWSLFIQTLKLAVTSKMLWLHPMFIHQGVSNAIFFGAFPLQMDKTQIGFVIATFALTDALGSIFWGKMYDWKGWKVCAIFAAVMGPIAYFTSTWGSLGIWPLYLGAVGFGLLDACQNTVVFGIISSVFGEETEMMCAFGVSKFFTAFASGLIFVVIPYLNYYTIAIIASVNVVFACGCIAGSYTLHSFPALPALPFAHNKATD